MSKSQHEIASEILAQALEMEQSAALQFIKQQCDDDKALLDNVMELYTSINEVDDVKVVSKQEPTQRLKAKSQLLRSQIISSWTKVLFGNKRNRLLVLITSLFLLFSLGVVLELKVRQNTIENERQRLQTLLRSNYNALNKWTLFNYQRVESLAKLPEIVALTNEVDSLIDERNGYDFLIAQKYNDKLRQILTKYGVYKYASAGTLVHKNDPKFIITSGKKTSKLSDALVGGRLKGFLYNMYNQLKDDPKSTFIKPVFDTNYTYDFPDSIKPIASLGFITPVYKNDSVLVGYFLYALNPAAEFSQILNISHFGESGETYAFDEFAFMLSESRFTDKLKQTILLADKPKSKTIYSIQLRNPGGDVMNGYTPQTAKEDWPLTEVVKTAFKADDVKAHTVFGEIMKPYRDYRGIKVVSAWLWSPTYDFGIVTEIDAEEALSNLRYFHIIFGGLFLIILVLSILLYNSNVRIALIGKKVEDFNKIGQYRLREKLGEGGFGEVYRAEHTFLKTDVAIKILKKEFNGSDMLDRFEKEVKVTSSLHHPNTVRVFDYGTSEQGQFYYVMEHLNGIPLNKIVDMGDVPVARGIFVLKQICYSLLEAHKKGLIHRDVKPANIMVCNQGGAYDTIKLLDFGLVKDVNTTHSQQTQINRIGGTPMFMAPERIRDPFNNDYKVDTYSIGAVGLYMFSGQYLVELISQKMLSGEQTISGNLQQLISNRDDIPAELLDLLMQCVHFSANKRPASTEELITRLEHLSELYPWTNLEAKSWWTNYDVYG